MFSILLYFYFINFFILFVNILLFLVRFNIILILLLLEIILFFINIDFIIISILYNDILGQIFSLFIISIAGIEVSIGLIFFIIYYKITDILYINNLILLKS